jgi:thiol-disulfide isomerase/thioredoxin
VKQPFSTTLVIALAFLSGCAPSGAVVGAQAPDFEILPLTLNAKPKTLSDFKGKVLIVDFWATWCGPCRQSFPHMQVLHDELKSEGLEIIAITDEDVDVVDEFVRKNGYDFGIYRDPYRVSNSAYGVRGLPTTFVVDRQGKIVGQTVGYSPGELESYVTAALRG